MGVKCPTHSTEGDKKVVRLLTTCAIPSTSSCKYHWKMQLPGNHCFCKKLTEWQDAPGFWSAANISAAALSCFRIMSSSCFLHQRVKEGKYTCSWFCSRCKTLHPWSTETCLKNTRAVVRHSIIWLQEPKSWDKKTTDKIPQCNNITTWLIHGQIPKRINRRDTVFPEEVWEGRNLRQNHVEID